MIQIQLRRAANSIARIKVAPEKACEQVICHDCNKTTASDCNSFLKLSIKYIFDT